MEKKEYNIEDFLAEVDEDYKEFVLRIDSALIEDGCKSKVESKTSGMFVGYSEPKTRRSIVNILFRKKGMLMRLYADGHAEYNDFIKNLPENMEKQIAKSSPCKRFDDPLTCNDRCIMGYDFYIRDNHYQKCRYNCFEFLVDTESIPVMAEFVDRERKARFG